MNSFVGWMSFPITPSAGETVNAKPPEDLPTPPVAPIKEIKGPITDTYKVKVDIIDKEKLPPPVDVP